MQTPNCFRAKLLWHAFELPTVLEAPCEEKRSNALVAFNNVKFLGFFTKKITIKDIATRECCVIFVSFSLAKIVKKCFVWGLKFPFKQKLLKDVRDCPFAFVVYIIYNYSEISRIFVFSHKRMLFVWISNK